MIRATLYRAPSATPSPADVKQADRMRNLCEPVPGKRHVHPDCRTCAMQQACHQSLRNTGVFARTECNQALCAETDIPREKHIGRPRKEHPVLDLLRDHPGLTTGELAQRCGIDRYTLNPVLRRLKTQGRTYADESKKPWHWYATKEIHE